LCCEKSKEEKISLSDGVISAGGDFVSSGNDATEKKK